MRFTDAKAYIRALGGTLIEWRLSGIQPQDAAIEVSYSSTGVDDWVHVATTSGAFVVDIVRRAYGIGHRDHYRLVVSSGGTQLDQTVIDASTVLVKSRRLKAKKILQDEYIVMSKKTGTPGVLWKRKHAGARCTCVDYSSGEPTNANCPLCYGTGLAGGYHMPVPYLVSLSSPKLKKIDTTDLGTVDNMRALQARAFICPSLDAEDIWMNCGTGERYRVGHARTTLYAGVPLLYESVELKPVEYSSAVYELPTDTSPSSMEGRIRTDAGMLLVYDTVLGSYYPLGILNGAVTIYSEPFAAYRVVAGILHLFDAATSTYLPVGLQDGAAVVFGSEAASRGHGIILTGGILTMWDTVREAYYRCGLSNGSFTVYEAI
jgi:DNA-directed RNA polymerase subunit H (RpoH/RPB5)